MNPAVLARCLFFAGLFAISCGGESAQTATPTPTPDVRAAVSAAIAATAEASQAETSVSPSSPPAPKLLLRDINAAMATLTSLQLEVTLVAKASRDAEAELFTFITILEGDLKPGGDNRWFLTATVENPEVTETFKLEYRTIEGIVYRSFRGDWQIVEDSSRDKPASLEAAAGRLRMESLVVEVDSLNDVPVYVLTGSVPDDPAAELVVLWVGVDDLLIRQMRVQGHRPASVYEGLIPGHLEEVFVTVSSQLSRFNVPVKIMAPGVAPTARAISPTVAPLLRVKRITIAIGQQDHVLQLGGIRPDIVLNAVQGLDPDNPERKFDGIRIEQGPFEFVPEESVAHDRLVFRREPRIPLRDGRIEIEEVVFLIVPDSPVRRAMYDTRNVNAVYEVIVPIVELTLSELNGTGVSGTALLVPEEGYTMVVLELSKGGMQSELVHIHSGQCGSRLGGVEYSLTSFSVGTLETFTAIDVPLARLKDGNHAINVHKAGDPSVYTACGNIPR